MVVACAPGAAWCRLHSGSAAESAPAKEKTTVVLWSSFTGKNGEAETEVVKRFGEANPDITLDYQFQGSYEETAQRGNCRTPGAHAPDISLMSDVWWFKFYLNQVILPLDDLMTA